MIFFSIQLLTKNLYSEQNIIKQHKVYTINELITISDQNYEKIKESRLMIDELRQRALQAAKWENPVLSASAGWKPDPENGYLYSLSITQKFPVSGRKAITREMEQIREQTAFIAYEDIKLYLRKEIFRLSHIYMALYEQSRHKKSRLTRLRIIGTYLKNRKILSPKGRVEKSVIESKIRLLEKEQLDADTSVLIAFNCLNRYLSLPFKKKNLPVVSIKWPETASPIDKDKTLSNALKKNLQIRIIQNQIKITQKKADIEKTKKIPDVSVSVFYNEEDAGGKDRSVGGSLSMPLPLADTNRNAVDAEILKIKQHKLRLSLAEKKLINKLKILFEEYAQAGILLQKFRMSDLNKIRKDVRYADREFIKGRIGMDNYLGIDETAHLMTAAIYDTQIRYITIWTRIMYLTSEFPMEEFNR